jgi:hypothetical protein
MSDDADDNHVYEAMLIELGAKVMSSWDSSQIRVQTRTGQAEAVTMIRSWYGTPGGSKEGTHDVRHPVRPNGDSGLRDAWDRISRL